MSERDEVMERLRATIERMRRRVNHLPDRPEPKIPEPPPDAPPPPRPWSDREPGEEG